MLPPSLTWLGEYQDHFGITEDQSTTSPVVFFLLTIRAENSEVLLNS